MKKNYAYWIGAAMIVGSLVAAPACTKSTSDDEDLIGNWTRSDDYEKEGRSEAISFTIGENVYVGLGATNTERFDNLMEYNTSRRYWVQKASLPGAARSSAVAFAIGDKGYVGTGYDGVDRLNDFWEYDPANNSWTQKANFAGTARYDAVGFAVNNKGYIACGYDGNALKDMWEYNPSTDSWTQRASVAGAKRMAAIAFVHNNTAYILGGTNNGEVQRDLYAYDAGTDTWTLKKYIYDYSDDSYDDDWGTIARHNGVAFVMGNYVYLTTGESGSLNSTTWRYDPANDTWLEKTSFEGTARTGAVAFTLNDRGFVVLGRSGSLMLDNMFELHPDDEQQDDD